MNGVWKRWTGSPEAGMPRDRKVVNGMDERERLSPVARRRRAIVADVELVISYATGLLTAVIGGVFLRAFGLL